MGQEVAQIHRPLVGYDHAPHIAGSLSVGVPEGPQWPLVFGLQDCLPPGFLNKAGGWVLGVILEVEKHRPLSSTSLGSRACVDLGSLNGFLEQREQLLRLISPGFQAVAEGPRSLILVLLVRT